MNRPPDSASGGAAVWDAGSCRLGYAVRRWIAALDPIEDNEEVARRTFEVLYGDPISVHTAYLIGFSRQVAVQTSPCSWRARARQESGHFLVADLNELGYCIPVSTEGAHDAPLIPSPG